MKREMHYEGAYCLARLAGLNAETAQLIAYANTYVDYSTDDEVENHENGGMVVAEETAHHVNQAKNINRVHQRYIWTPFHFLPSCEGDNFYEKVVCVKANQNPLAKPMMEHHLKASLTSDFGKHLIGITTHVLQDSFSHQGFSGVASPYNCLEGNSIGYLNATDGTRKYLDKEKRSFLQRFRDEIKGTKAYIWLANLAGGVAEEVTGGLGHAAAFTCPDLPYLHWTYRYEEGPLAGEEQQRDNRREFLESCQSLHGFLTQVAAAHPDWADLSWQVPWSNALENNLKQILQVQNGTDERADEWRKAFMSGKLHPAGMQGEKFDPFDDKNWHKVRDQFSGLEHPGDMIDKDVYHFYQAASYHRHYMLRELMPQRGVVMI